MVSPNIFGFQYFLQIYISFIYCIVNVLKMQDLDTYSFLKRKLSAFSDQSRRDILEYLSDLYVKNFSKNSPVLLILVKAKSHSSRLAFI